jgi:anti-sigma regulatory factor (Ser/Thr protein kinase)
MNVLNAEKELRTEIQDIPLLYDFIETFLSKVDAITEGQISQDLNYEIQLAVEEWYVNIVKHGFRGEPQGHVLVQLHYEEGWITIRITDDGPAFDPNTIPHIVKQDNLPQVKIGGLGFHLIRNVMDSTNYVREGGKNILTMMKRYE